MKALIRKCYKKDYNYNPDYNFEKTKVYEVLSDEFQLLFWNSSNSNRIDNECLEGIAEQLENGQMSGSVSDPHSMAEIMWEVREL